MSVLPESVHAELAQLLDALQSADNSVRSQAEEHLANNWTTTRPDVLLMGLVEQIRGSNDPTVLKIVFSQGDGTDKYSRHDHSRRLSSDVLHRRHEKQLMTRPQKHS
jgi:hypothetical protein